MKKERKSKWNIIKTVAYIMCLSFLCVGCNKVASQNYDMENFCAEDVSVYNFSQYLAELKNVVATARYDEDTILLYEELLEEGELHKKVWLFSYLTGEKQMCSDLTVTVDTDYRVTADRFSVISAKPLVLADIYANEIIIYTDDMSGYSVLAVGDYKMPQGVCVRGDSIYFMEPGSCKVYVRELEGFRATVKQMDFESFREASRQVFSPDINMTDCELVNVSEDGVNIRVYAESLLDNEYYYYDYNTETQLCEEMYRFKKERDFLWNSWEYEKCFSAVRPSAVARYEWSDNAENKVYTVKIEPVALYSRVEFDRNIDEVQEKLLFYAVDENEDKITEIFLWDYTKAESDAITVKPEKIQSEIPKEIDYAELTDKAELLEEKYGINIIMGENVVCEFDAYEYVQVTDEERIYYALEQLEAAMDVFPDGMCREMAENYAQGFNVYLCGAFKPKNEENISDAGAFFTFDNNYYNVAMNIMQDNTEANLIHEMAHAIDNYFVFCGAAEQLEEDWQKCNPDGFEYLNSYFDYEEEYAYTYGDVFEDIDDVYFCDTYAKTYPGEDRSRVMEYFGAEDYKEDPVLESESLRKKARLLLDYCTEHLECFREDEVYGLKLKAEEMDW